jgi:hypothetical protein
MNLIGQSHDIFSKPTSPIPRLSAGSATSMQPQQDIINFDSAQSVLPSISIELTTSMVFHLFHYPLPICQHQFGHQLVNQNI